MSRIFKQKTLVKCDRCGIESSIDTDKEGLRLLGSSFTRENGKLSGTPLSLDFCKDCKKDFDKWIRLL